MTSEDAAAVWADVALASALLAIDPSGLGGIALRSAPGAERDEVCAQLRALSPASAPFARIPLHITEDRLPNTPVHHVLLNCALGDMQVSPLGAHMMARAVKAKNLTPVNREVFGIDDASEVVDGNALTEFDFHLPESPKTNLPPTGPDEDDPHDKVRQFSAVFDQTDLFLRTGKAKNLCTDKCDPE